VLKVPGLRFGRENLPQGKCENAMKFDLGHENVPVRPRQLRNKQKFRFLSVGCVGPTPHGQSQLIRVCCQSTQVKRRRLTPGTLRDCPRRRARPAQSLFLPVIPAQAGIQSNELLHWVPAFAGTTNTSFFNVYTTTYGLLNRRPRRQCRSSHRMAGEGVIERARASGQTRNAPKPSTVNNISPAIARLICSSSVIAHISIT
jgi:hypothetical protein